MNASTKTSRLPLPGLALAAIAVGLGIWAVVPAGGEGMRTLSIPDVPRHQIQEPAASLIASIEGLPNFLYAGEELNFLVKVENPSKEALACSVEYDSGNGVQARELDVPAAGEKVAVFPLVGPPLEQALVRQVRVTVDAEPVWSERFVLANGRAAIEGVEVRGRCFVTTSGERVMLVNRYENETTYRRWAPIKWAKRELERPGAKILLSVPAGLYGLDTGRTALLSERDTRLLAYTGAPLCTALALNQEIPAEGPTILCLGWGYEEAIEHFPVRDLVRALDLAIDRARLRNPAVQVLLVIPPPPVGAEETAGAYARALRRLAREHHTGLLDLYASTAALPDWQALYCFEDDPAVCGRFPAAEGQARFREQLRKALQ